MRRSLALITAILMVPATAVGAADLSDLLEESGEASYEAEQVITCSTPDGVRDAVIALTQSGGEIHIGASVDPEVEVASGDGGWTLVRGGSVVSSVNLQATTSASGSRYTVDDGSVTEHLGREATLYRMVDEGTLRAELVLDEEVGALLRVTTFTADGRVYCERRFITFEPGDPAAEVEPVEPDADPDVPVVETSLPEELGAFERLDVYGDEAGFLFAYYSDGFFSFAVFETPSVVTLDDPSVATVNDRPYTRVFGPGQVTYVWETLRGGMALVGDLPPDMHQTVLSGLPAPADPGLFRRLWRNLFG